MLRFVRSSCAVSAAIAASTLSAFGQDAVTLPEIVVTTRRAQPAPAQRSARAQPASPQAPSVQPQDAVEQGASLVINQPESVSVVRRQQIEQTPAQSIDDVLRTTTSVNLGSGDAASYQIHPHSNTISMRGLGGTRALVLLDGVPLNDPFVGFVQWNRVPLENIERVEVVRGGGSPLWGNYAMGGVINIISKTPDKNEVSGEAGYGSYGTYRVNGAASYVASDALKIRGNVSQWGTNGFQQVAPSYGPIYIPTSFDAFNAQLSAFFNPDPSLHGYVRFNGHRNDQTLLTRLSTNNQEIYDFSGSVTKTIGASDVTLTAFHQHTNYSNANTNTPSGVPAGFGEYVQNRHTNPTDSTGASLLWSTRINDVFRRVTLGADVHSIAGQDTADIFAENGTQVRTDIGRGKQRFVGTFAQFDIFPTEQLELLASVRYQNFFNYDGFNGVTGAGVVPNTSADSVDPRLSVRYALMPNFALRAAAYTSFRAPTLSELYGAFSVPFGIFSGNSQLKPEKLKGAEAGFDVKWGPMLGQVIVYTNEITDFITSRNLDPSELPPGFFFGSRKINAGKAKSDGLEANLEWLIMPGLRANFGYNLYDSKIVENQFEPGSVGKQQAGIPLQMVTAGLAYSDPRGWRASARVRWLDKSWGDNLNTLPIDSHFVVDASFGYKLTKQSELFLNIQNLFDRRYIADNSGIYPPLFGTPLSVFGGLRATF